MYHSKLRVLEPLLPGQIQMPLQHLLEHGLPVGFNDIAVTRDNPVKVPFINSRRGSSETLPIPRARAPPNHSLLRQRLALRARQRAKNPRQEPRARIHARLAELLRGRAVEHVIRFDKRSGRAVVEHNLLVGVRVHVFPVEFCVEFWRYGLGALGCAEEVCEGHVFFGGVFCAQFGEGFRAHYFGLGIRRVPGAEEDVVLEALVWYGLG